LRYKKGDFFVNNFKKLALSLMVLTANLVFADRGGFGAGFGTGLAIGTVGTAIATRPVDTVEYRDYGYDYNYDYPADYRYARDERDQELDRSQVEYRRLRNRNSSNN
jgi:hypothetical protein